MKKRASLSLSVNAIVILIIAVVMLGLALGFIKMMFGGATQKFAALIEQEQEPIAPTASTPMTLSRGMVLATPNQPEVIKMGLYNPTASDWKGWDCSGTPTGGAVCSPQGQFACESQTDAVCRWDPAAGGTGACLVVLCTDGLLNQYPSDCKKQPGCVITPSVSGVQPVAKCGGAAGVAAVVTGDGFITNPRIIPAGEYVTYDILFTVAGTVPQPSSYICEVEAYAYDSLAADKTISYSHDFTLSVK